MVNVLIADDNWNYARNLMAFINEKSNKVRVTNITINGEETLKVLNGNNLIDIVLLDLKMPIYSGIEVIEKLDREQREKYYNSFIIISGEFELMEDSEIRYNQVVNRILPKTLSMEQIVAQINGLIIEREENQDLKNIKAKITNELLYLGYDFSNKGTRYLIEAIELIYIRGENFMENLNKYVYPIIAQRYNQSTNNIKCNIIRATENMYYNCNEMKLVNYFSLQMTMKPNIKTVINTVLIKIDTK